MRELEQKEKIEITETKQEERKEVFVGSARLKRGHRCWELNILTQQINEAKFDQEAVDFGEAQKGSLVARRKLLMKQGCLYFNGLNKKSAMKQYRNLLNVNEVNIKKDLDDIQSQA